MAKLCTQCGAEMKMLLTSWYCPREPHQVLDSGGYDMTRHVWASSAYNPIFHTGENGDRWYTLVGPQRLHQSANLALSQHRFAILLDGIDGRPINWWVSQNHRLYGRVVKVVDREL